MSTAAADPAPPPNQDVAAEPFFAHHPSTNTQPSAANTQSHFRRARSRSKSRDRNRNEHNDQHSRDTQHNTAQHNGRDSADGHAKAVGHTHAEPDEHHHHGSRKRAASPIQHSSPRHRRTPERDSPPTSPTADEAGMQSPGRSGLSPGKAGGPAKGPAGVPGRPLCRLSFEDELEEENVGAGAMASFSLAASTVHRFATERSIEVVNVSYASPALNLQLDMEGALRSATEWQQQGGTLRRGPAGAPKQHLGPIQFGVASARGLRPYMEDRHCVVAAYMPLSAGQPIPDGINRSFAAVFDGHNGVKAAEHATQRLQQLLAEEPALRTCTGDGPPSMDGHEEEQVAAAFKRAFHAVDQEILQTAREEELRDGATALVVVRIGEILYAAHAGDSRAVMSRQGQAYRLTEDHKPELPRERSRVEQLGGRVEFQRCWRIISEPRWDRPLSGLAVSRSFGDLDFKEPKRYVESEPDVHRVRLQAGDTFVVLASDGLWDVFTDQEAVDVVGGVLTQQAGGKRFDDAMANAAAHALVDAALDRRTQDNVTAVVLLLQWD